MARKRTSPQTRKEGDNEKSMREKEESDRKEASTEESPPLSDLYKLIRFKTVRKSGRWWTVAMVIQVPNGHQRLSVYRYQFDAASDRWKKRSSININSESDLDSMLEAISEIRGDVKWRGSESRKPTPREGSEDEESGDQRQSSLQTQKSTHHQS